MKRYLMTFLVAFMAFHCMEASPSQADSHDIASLHAWGPYSKRYAGISHIPDMSKGIRFDFSVMPGYYRNRQLVPQLEICNFFHPSKNIAWNPFQTLALDHTLYNKH